MPMINYARREINCKIVYYGPALAGKTTNLRHLYSRVDPATRGKMISLSTEADRTLFFDFLPVDLGRIQGFKARFHLYAVPGQVHFSASPKLILQGVDGIVFVADSQRHRSAANIEAMHSLRESLESHVEKPSAIPLVLQYNKRDLEDVSSVPELRAQLNPDGVPELEAVATKGSGVVDTFEAASELVVETLS